MGPVVGHHPWIFSQALLSIPDGIPPGEPMRLMSENGAFLALGYFSSYSQIAVRVWGYDESEKIDEDFFARRIGKAHALRKRYVETPHTNAYRVVNGEGDLLPGLILDKYADYIVLQFHTRGIDRWKKEIVGAIKKVLQPAGIYERSDVSVRKTEMLEEQSGLITGSIPSLITIQENGYTFLVDVRHGQKTGFFLDQRDKRKDFMKYTTDRSVLNCFSYTGAFSVYALGGGARTIVSIDASAPALELAKENIKLNPKNAVTLHAPVA